ncbi:MAG: hypothetical protein E4H20_09070, partial [Spirochaetales bacterium]
MDYSETSTTQRPSWLAITTGIIFSLAGIALFTELMLGLLAGSDRMAGLAGFLLSGLSWAAFFLPAYFWTAAVVLFIPGFRKDLLFALVGSLVPFAAMAALARFLDDTEGWFGAWPAFRALGATGTALLWGGLALISACGVLVLRARLFGPDGIMATGPRPAGEALLGGNSGVASAGTRRWKSLWGEKRPDAVSAERAGASVESGREPPTVVPSGDAAGYDFKLPDMPPSLKLASLARATFRDRTDDPMPEGTAGIAEFDNDAMVEDVEELGDASEFDSDEPIPVMFGRQGSRSIAAEYGESIPGSDNPAEDPALSAEFWS